MARSTIDHVNAICLGWALALLGIGLNLFYGHPVGTMAGVASMGMAHLIAGEMAFASGVPRRWLLALYWASSGAKRTRTSSDCSVAIVGTAAAGMFAKRTSRAVWRGVGRRAPSRSEQRRVWTGVVRAVWLRGWQVRKKTK